MDATLAEAARCRVLRSDEVRKKLESAREGAGETGYEPDQMGLAGRPGLGEDAVQVGLYCGLGDAKGLGGLGDAASLTGCSRSALNSPGVAGSSWA